MKYMHNIVTKDANRFYIDRVKAYKTIFEQAVRMIYEEYNSSIRQARVNKFLNSLHVDDYLGDKIDEALDFAKVYKPILKIVPSSPDLGRRRSA